MGDSTSSSFQKPRQVAKRVLAKAQFEGPARIRKTIGSSELQYFDPFIFFDYFSVRAPAGFPDHPHRGFETVTYMLQGSSSHQDFAGHKGTINSGDVQWMTAGRGIVHSEWPSGEGDNIGFQIWINLSSKNKMMKPRYQELESKDIPRVQKDGVDVKIIAGESFGVRSRIFTATPTMFLDFTMSPGAQVHQRIPESWNSCLYVLEGEGVFGSRDAAPAGKDQLLVLSTPGDGLSVWNRAKKPLRFALIAGEPLNEAVVQEGPFVMNTQAEIVKAIQDYQQCKNGFEKAKHWKSSKPNKR